MENALPKIKSSVSAAPIGAVIGGIVMYMVAKKVGYHKTITVVPFTVVGIILGATIGSRLK